MSYVTKFGAGPPSKVFQIVGPLQDLRQKPRCILELDTRYKSLKKVGGKMTVSQCAERSLKLARKDPAAFTALADINVTTTNTTPSFGPFYWSYNFAAKLCFTIDLTDQPEVTSSVGWASGSPACGVPASSDTCINSCD